MITPELLAVGVCLYILYTYLCTEKMRGEPKQYSPQQYTWAAQCGRRGKVSVRTANTCQTLGCLEIHCHFPVHSVLVKGEVVWMWALGDLPGQRNRLHSCSSSSLSGPQANCRALNLCYYSTLRTVLKVLPSALPRRRAISQDSRAQSSSFFFMFCSKVRALA